MAFLQVNGYTIPVATVRRKDLLIGKRGRAYDGMPQTQDRGRKMILECKTPPLIEQTREAIIGIIQGDGFVWPYSTPATLRGTGGDFYSHKGVGPATGLDQATVHGYLAGDGAPVSLMEYLHTDAESSYTPLRNGMLSVDPDTTNLLAADQRDAEGVVVGSYVALNGATLSMNTSHYWQGAQSLKIITDAVGADIEGAETSAIDPGAGSATKTYVGSVYVKNGSGSSKAIKVTLRDLTNVAYGTVAIITVPNGEWARFASLITIGGAACRDLRLQIEENVQDSAVTMYCDGFQIEEQDYPTAWVDGARGGADDLGYDFDFNYSFTDWSAGIWFWGPEVARYPGTAAARLFNIRVSGGIDTRVIRQNATADIVNWQIITDTTVSLNTGAGDVDWEAWNFLGVSFRKDPETGELEMTMRLINASSSTTYTGTGPAGAVLDEAAYIYVGNVSGGSQWPGHLGEFMLFPFAVPVGVWDGIATTLGLVGVGTAGAIPLPQWPRKLVTGDIGITQPIGSPARLYGALFEGDVGGVDMMVGSARTNLGAVAFTLGEV